MSLSLAGSFLAAAIAAVPSSARRVYFADLQRAAEQTAEGRSIKAEIEASLAKVEDEVHARESALAKKRKALEKSGGDALRAEYDREAEALERFIAEEQAKLDRRQEERVTPLVDRLRALMQTEKNSLVLDADEYPPVAPKKGCDASAWLAALHETKKAGPLPNKEECEARAIFLVSMAPVARAMEESKRATARLDAFQRSKQAELDAKQAELRRAESSPDHERLRLELAARYAEYKRELEEREKAEEKRVDDAARALIARVEASLPGALFVEKIEDAAALQMPSCDATRFLVELVEGKSSAAKAGEACPAYHP